MEFGSLARARDAVVLATLTMRGCCEACKKGSIAWIMCTGPKTFVSYVCLISATVISRAGRLTKIPALLIKTSTCFSSREKCSAKCDPISWEGGERKLHGDEN